MHSIHYRPEDGFFGDPIPFYWDGTYHVFYDKLGRDEKIRWAHIASKDLVNWSEMPDALTLGGPGSLDENLCITGSIVEKDGVFHAFYTGVGKQGSNICEAVSRDLIQWKKRNIPVIPGGGACYRADGTWRDPCVFYNAEAGQFWMFLCARRAEENDHSFAGTLAFAVSEDLTDWRLREPAWQPNIGTAVECPDVFCASGRWVMSYFWHETRYRLASSPMGPWVRPIVQAPDSFDFFAGKSMDDGKRRILIGWIPRRACDCSPRIWGGNMAVARELWFLADGTPATRCAPEVYTAICSDRAGAHDARVFRPVTGSWEMGCGDARAVMGDGGGLCFWKEAPADYYLKMDVTFHSPRAGASFLLRTGPSEDGASGCETDEGYQLLLDPVEDVVRLRELYQWDQRPDLAVIRFDFPAGSPVCCRLFVDGDIFELFIGEKRSMVGRLMKHQHGGLGLYVQDGSVGFTGLSIHTLHREGL